MKNRGADSAGQKDVSSKHKTMLSPTGGSVGEAAWRWHRQQRFVARVSSPARALTVAVSILVWRLAPQPPGEHVGLVTALAVAAACYSPVAIFMPFRRPDLAIRFYQLQAVLDDTFILAWVILTRASADVALPLLYLGVMLAPLRLPPVASLVAATLYAGVYAVIAHGVLRFGSVYMLLGAWVLSSWVAVGLRDQRDSVRDELTGCFGRAYALFHLESWMEHGTLPLSVALVDMDGFKGVNDTYGHQEGDAVLREGALLMATALREGDVLARYGGDEFLILWPSTDGPDAQRAAERLRESFERSTFHLRQEQAEVHLTASVGVVTVHQRFPVPEVLRLVDANMYRAKETRNRVVASDLGLRRAQAIPSAARDHG